MSTACAEQRNKFTVLKDIEIPPRKLLFSHNHVQDNAAMQLSPNEAVLQKYLLSNRNNNGEDEENDADPYAADHFRMYEFKVRKCTRSRSHDWTDCPFAHPGEKARRRDPRRYPYSSTICSDFLRGGRCPRGDDCDFAHGVFECWLHPTRYRTEACKDGKNCKRKVCFFAHSSRELRLLPAEASPKYKNSGSCSSSPLSRNTHCCLFCHSATSSPTSTLLGLSHLSRSPSLSPSLSPVKQQASLNGFSPIYSYSHHPSKLGTETMSYSHVLNELMSSMEKMNFYEASSPVAVGNIPWLDVDVHLKGEVHSQTQFALSPSWPSPCARREHFGATSKPFGGDDEKRNENGVGCDSDPDLGWVNELLM
ncbi:Zinc finger CCCH domain-containing protein 49 [Hibiscus syriacus]|uniref:Zinc finger CCCH domain-containing protein 49 n=1 Tax=Hibiscus syriacus TaxID=106335 RepID=A0A6A3A3N9_HIBSY|nr:zinc finger CCCH domain-containing protein 2-like [Hibiscus syriacus]KAE8698456.1 Zinc finger CCCH domain-containing protein 49 [Hibiscus syriacus]